jgi:hypothetical protein
MSSTNPMGFPYGPHCARWRRAGLAQLSAGLIRSLARSQRQCRYPRTSRLSYTPNAFALWATLGFAPRDYMQRAFIQRRNQIIGDCCQLKIDVDVYNDLNPTKQPIQLVLNFEDDVSERQYWDDNREAA